MSKPEGRKTTGTGQIDRRSALKFDGTCETPATVTEMIRWALGPYYRRKIGKDGVGDLAATIAYGVESIVVEDRRLVVYDMSPEGDVKDTVSYRGAVGQPDELVAALRANYAHVVCMAAGIPEEYAVKVGKAAAGGLSARVALGMTTRAARKEEDEEEEAQVKCVRCGAPTRGGFWCDEHKPGPAPGGMHDDDEDVNDLA